MASVHAMIAALDELLGARGFPDMGPNGLQVPGREEVSRVVTGVSATRALIERAVELDAGLVLVHHGLFWDFAPTGLTPVLAARLRPLFVHDIGLAAYHLPLDAHAELGNNAVLAREIGLADLEPWAEFKGHTIGQAGRFPEPVPVAELVARVHRATDREPLLQGAGPELVRTVGLVTGSAAGSLFDAVSRGFDAFITGEPKEHVMADAEEAGIHFLAAGHYATETFGVRGLGAYLEREFGVEHVWVDLPNPV